LRNFSPWIDNSPQYEQKRPIHEQTRPLRPEHPRRIAARCAHLQPGAGRTHRPVALACSRRVKQLEDDGYISRQVALLDRKKLGLSLTAYVLIGMDRHTPSASKLRGGDPQPAAVLECSLVTGMDADYQLKVVVPDMDHYQKLLLGSLTRIEGVTSVRSSFVLNQVLASTELPLTHLR
jgi:Lrp/AsnC family leucine-responsive transcriptional regulator